MSTSNLPSSGRSISIGGNVNALVIQAGDGNTTSIKIRQAALPLSEKVDMSVVMDALEKILDQLESPDQRKIRNAVDDAKEELKKPEPDKDEVGRALHRALSYAQNANGFAETIETLRPHVEKVAGWLGQNWYKILSLVGLAV